MVGISRPVVKHSFLVKQTEDIPGILKKAFWLAASGRPGPVVVDLPKDILNPAKKLPYVWPDAVSMRSYNPTTSGHKGQIKRALQTLVAAKKTGRVRWRRGNQFAVRSTAAYAGRKS
jgi:Thiamine pyrophosphate-requiring enzymes [acetolactate synthase, pyruvate dehydrogenase (cytochrome), glyoxylate carboligase, phosphonopyruvate decarboxylase]